MIINNNYLKLIPNRFENEKLKLLEKNSDNRYDVENIGMDSTLVVSERFKHFCEENQLNFQFFPILVEKERRYLMMWRELPVISEFEIDLKNSIIFSSGRPFYSPCHFAFRSDILEYYKYDAFTEPTKNYIYITEDLKMLFENNNFMFSYTKIPVTKIRYKEKMVRKVLLEARKEERKWWLSEQFYDTFQAADDVLEQFLIKEGDKEVLDKFRNEMKGEWKKDFEKYKKDHFKPEERITYW